MRSFRSKPVGWRYDSTRHALAARGVKTKVEEAVDILSRPDFQFLREENRLSDTKPQKVSDVLTLKERSPWVDVLKGGKGDRLRPKDVDQRELLMGIEEEREHTSDVHVATEIALDHLAEDPQFYTHLKQSEQKIPGYMSARDDLSVALRRLDVELAKLDKEYQIIDGKVWALSKSPALPGTPLAEDLKYLKRKQASVALRRADVELQREQARRDSEG